MYNVSAMVNRTLHNRLNCVRYHLKHGQSLRKTALRFSINYMTFYKWLKSYNKHGEVRFLSAYRRPWNRTNMELEKKIVLLKEKEPTLTVRAARGILERAGIKISIKGIWAVWKRYGFAGFDKEKVLKDFPRNCSWSAEATKTLKAAKACYDRGNQEKAASLLNSIPVLPENDLILEIPDTFLNLNRKLEKTALLYGKVPLAAYRQQVKALCNKCQGMEWYYSLLRIGTIDVGVLSYLSKPKEMLTRARQLKIVLMNKKRLLRSFFYLKVSLLVGQGVAYIFLNRIKEASRIAKTCNELLRRQRNMLSYDLMQNLGALYIYLENFKKAEYWYLRALTTADRKNDKFIKDDISQLLFYKGEYKRALSLLREIEEFEWWAHQPKILIFQAMWSLTNGKPDRTISLCTKALSISNKEDLVKHIIATYSIIASAYCSFGKNKRAIGIIKKVIVLTRKSLKSISNRYLLLADSFSKGENGIRLSAEDLPTIKLLNFLKMGAYYRAYSYAQRKYLMGYFYQYIFFFPELVIKLLEKRKPTLLPSAMIKLPVFNTKVPVYSIRFLGNLVAYKNQKYLKVKMLPKDMAFVINLALRIGEPGKKILLKELYDNFWSDSSNPARNLSHLLVRIKKTLKIPTHLLEISHRSGASVLINRGIHFISDYTEFEQILAAAHAFERVDKWWFARKEYLHAFRLLRGEPFKKMYDNWSENMRRAILNKLETETVHFAKICMEYRVKKDALQILKRILKIIPDSNEIKNMIKTLNFPKIVHY